MIVRCYCMLLINNISCYFLACALLCFPPAKIHIYFYMCKRVHMKRTTKLFDGPILGVRYASGEIASVGYQPFAPRLIEREFEVRVPRRMPIRLLKSITDCRDFGNVFFCVKCVRRQRARDRRRILEIRNSEEEKVALSKYGVILLP